MPDAEAPLYGGKHAIDELVAALNPTAANLSRVEVYGQLAYVPTPALTPGQLQANLHVLSRTHYGLTGSGLRAGLFNLNSSSARYWRGIAATYNRLRPDKPLGISPSVFGNRMRDNFASASSDGKSMNGPFLTVENFLSSSLLTTALQDSGVTPTEFGEAMQAWLTIRSDTFRIRSYGDSSNPADSGKVEAEAWAEAIVQREPAVITGYGRRFVITGFRWLGPDDI